MMRMFIKIILDNLFILLVGFYYWYEYLLVVYMFGVCVMY